MRPALSVAPRPAGPARRTAALLALALAVVGAHVAVVDSVGAALARPTASGRLAAGPVALAGQRVQIVQSVQSVALPLPGPPPAAARTATDDARPDGQAAAVKPLTPLTPPTTAPAQLAPDHALGPSDAPLPPGGPASDASPAGAEEPVIAAAPLSAEAFGLAFVAATAAAPASSPAVAPPVYPTRLPGAARLEYELRRGPVGGSATLRWLPVADRYTLSLEGGTLGFTVLSQASEGGYDRAGIAPYRFVDRRRGRDARAANFQRDSGRITFSGPSVEYVLLPGSQDRLSWMLQAAAIVNAAPGRFVPGSELSMFVAGARGDADVWTFDVVARESIELPAGKVAGALRLKREPRKPFDTEVEVWLDPARQYLPVRLRLATPQTGESTDFALRSAELR